MPSLSWDSNPACTDRMALLFRLRHHHFLKLSIFNRNIFLEKAAKTEELQDLMVDLEVKEAGFNNRFRETAEGHKEEIEVLVSKIENAKQEVSDLHETVAKLKAEHATNVDEMIKTRKTEINALQDEVCT